MCSLSAFISFSMSFKSKKVRLIENIFFFLFYLIMAINSLSIYIALSLFFSLTLRLTALALLLYFLYSHYQC